MPKSKLFAKPSTLRVVVDTNLFVRGLMKGAVTRPLIEAWKDDDLKDDTPLKAQMQNTYGVTIVGVPEFMAILERRRGCWPLG